MGIYRESPTNRTRSVTGKVTSEEKLRIAAYVASCGSDESTMTRELWLAEIGEKTLSAERSASTKMLNLFMLTMKRSLADGEPFTADEFDKLCAEVKDR